MSDDDGRNATRRKLNFFQTLSAVLWSFFGVRRNRGYEEDAARLNPVHVIIAGLLAAVLFVVVLMVIVRLVVG